MLRFPKPIAVICLLALAACRGPFGTLGADTKPARVSFMHVTAPFMTDGAHFTLRNIFRFGTAHTSRYSGHKESVSMGEPLVMSGVVGGESDVMRALSPLGLSEVVKSGHWASSETEEGRFSYSGRNGADYRLTVGRGKDGAFHIYSQNVISGLPTDMVFDLPRGESVALGAVSGTRLELLIVGIDAAY